MKRLLIFGVFFIGFITCLFANERTLVGKVENGFYHSPSNLFKCMIEDFGESDYSIEDHAENGFQLVQFTNSDGTLSFVTCVMPISTKSTIPSFIFRTLINRHIKSLKEKVAKNEKVSVLEKGTLEKKNHFAVATIEKKSNSKSKEPIIPQTFKGVLTFQHEDRIALIYMSMDFPAENAYDLQRCVEVIRGKLKAHQEKVQFPVSDEV